MIISWQVGKRRVANGVRPGALAAWGLVLLDWAIILVVLGLLWNPLMALFQATKVGNIASYIILFVVYFIPMQIVLITSSIWAVRSRWEDSDRNQN